MLNQHQPKIVKTKVDIVFCLSLRIEPNDMKKLLLVVFTVLSINLTYAQVNNPDMSNDLLAEILNKVCYKVEGDSGYWNVYYKDRMIIVITDQKNNRMRMICPIVEQKKVKSKEMEEVMAANFDRALDVKYATYDNYLWSIFVHRLKELTPDQLYDAIDQVYMAAATYGSSYTSTNLVFGGGNKGE